MRLVRRVLVVCTLSGLVSAGFPALSAAPDGSRGCGSWEFQFSPNPMENDYLFAVAAVSATDVWAVGHAFTEGGAEGPLIERWNGSSWNVVTTSLPDNANLYAISAVDADDIWAVGSTFSVTTETFAAHWDGSSWSSVPVPSPGSSAQLLGVAAIAPDDVWAVGWRDPPPFGSDQTLVEHWDGSSWTIVRSPSPNASQQLNDVSGTSATDVWAVGYHSAGRRHHPLIERWDGSAWKVVESFRPDKAIDLTGVAALSATDAWAVGATDTAAADGRSFVEHWDGQAWGFVDEPLRRSELHAVAAGSPGDVWMVGRQQRVDTLTQHWDGESLSVVPSSEFSEQEDLLEDVDVLPSGEAWTVGYYYSDVGRYFTEIQHFLPC